MNPTISCAVRPPQVGPQDPSSSRPSGRVPRLGWPPYYRLAVSEVRSAPLGRAIVSGETVIEGLVNDHTGEIKAEVLERDGKIVIEKDLSPTRHFHRHTGRQPGFFLNASRRCFLAATSRPSRISTTMAHRRSSTGVAPLLTVDLTNRCNMMCDPCFMDANQVGYVHELTLDDVRKLLDDAISVKPKRQLSVQFSGGEPTISPHFLDSVSYAKELGYASVQAATNGIRFAQDVEFAHASQGGGTAHRIPPVRRRRQSSKTRTGRSPTFSTSNCGRSKTFTLPISTSCSS